MFASHQRASFSSEGKLYSPPTQVLMARSIAGSASYAVEGEAEEVVGRHLWQCGPGGAEVTQRERVMDVPAGCDEKIERVVLR